MSEDYEFIEIIGKGMYGKVLKALNKKENKYYAIKSLNFKDISEKERINIETEVNFLKELKHPNIVLYKDSFIDENNNLNIVTSFCEGGDLYKKLFKEKNNFFAEKTIINWLVQLLLGLSYIHDKKIVHRDIKTKNIFIQNENILKIGDFGIAKIFDQAQTQTMNKIVGTPLYMAPECFKQNKKYSYKSDIWSLGCCLYEMCNLKHAFEGKCFPAVSVKISEGKRAPVNKIYSQDLKNLVDSMLNLNQRHRPNIANILERPFMRGKVGEYINDFISNCKKYDGTEEQIAILREQAEKFQIFRVNLNKNINGNIYDNITIKIQNDNKLKLNLNNIYINNNSKNPGKKVYLKDNQNYISKNLHSKKDILENEFDKLGCTRNNNNEEKRRLKFKQKLSPSQYFDFNDKRYMNLILGKNRDSSKNNIKKISGNNSKNKKEIIKRDSSNISIKEKKNQKLFIVMNNDYGEPERKTDSETLYKKLISKQQSTHNYNIEFEYNEKQNSKKNNNNKHLKNKVIYSNNFIDKNDLSTNEKNITIEGLYNINNGLNRYSLFEGKELNNNRINTNKSMLLNKRINFFKERCLKSLGNNFYNKAYDYLKNVRKNKYISNETKREYLSNTFGKNNIGYWQLIDQILLLEDILETS